MMSRTKCLIFLLATLLTLPGVAQKAKTPKSKTQKADNAYNQANYSKAMELYKKSYAKQKNKSDKAVTAYKLGETYRVISNWKEAVGWYEKAVNDGNKDPMANWRYAEALKANGRYDEAIAQYNAYKALVPDDTRTDGAIQAATEAQAWKDKPTRAVVENVGALNTKYLISLLPGQILPNGIFFTSSRMEATGSNNDGWYGEKFFDLFAAAMDNNNKWSTPVAVPPPVNSTSSDGAAVWDAKNSVLYFTRCQKMKGKEGMCRIYKSVYANASWGTPEPLNFASEDILPVILH